MSFELFFELSFELSFELANPKFKDINLGSVYRCPILVDRETKPELSE